MKQRFVKPVVGAVIIFLVTMLTLTQGLSGSRKIALKTVYLHDVLEKAHCVMLKGELDDRGGGKGKLILDPNTCSLNDFGDRANCTKMAYIVYDVTFHGVKLADPSGMERKLYEISGAKLANKLFLVVPTKKGKGGRFRLVSKDRSGVNRVVTLEPLRAPGKKAKKG